MTNSDTPEYIEAAKSLEQALLEKFDSREECIAALAVARMLIMRGTMTRDVLEGKNVQRN